MVHAGIGNLGQQLLRLLGILVNPSLDLSKQLRAAALNHVAEKRPGRTAESNQWHSARQLLPRQSNGLVDVVELGGHVELSVEDLFVLSVGWGLERVREVRSLLVHHLDLHAQGLGDDEDVGEDDGSVQQALESLDWLQRQGGGDLGVSAALKEVARALGFMILGQVATSWENIVRQSCSLCNNASFFANSLPYPQRKGARQTETHLGASPTWEVVRRPGLSNNARIRISNKLNSRTAPDE
jgi:hypothetical protein